MIITPNLEETDILVPAQPKEMMSVTLLPDGRRLIRINYSSLSVIQECLRKAHYLLDLRWKSQNEGPATIFGSGIHAAMETFYTGAKEERHFPGLEKLEPLAFGHAPKEPGLVESAILSFVERTQALSGLPDNDKRSIPNGVWLLSEYFRTYIDDPFIAFVDAQGPFIERKFTMRVIDNAKYAVDLFGQIDFGFVNTADGTILCGDHKTTSQLGFGGSSYYDRDRPNHQYTGYVLAARNVFGFESYDFLVNVLEVKAKPVKSTTKGASFPRQITRRDESDFTEFIEVVEECVDRYLRAYDRGIWPLGPVGSCNSYGACTYKSVCSAPLSLRGNILSAKFKKETA